MSERDYPDQNSPSEADDELDEKVGAKMRLFLDRMIRAAREEEGLELDRTVDIMVCAAVQLYVEHYEATPQEVSVFCRVIAEDVLGPQEGGDTVH